MCRIKAESSSICCFSSHMIMDSAYFPPNLAHFALVLSCRDIVYIADCLSRQQSGFLQLAASACAVHNYCKIDSRLPATFPHKFCKCLTGQVTLVFTDTVVNCKIAAVCSSDKQEKIKMSFTAITPHKTYYMYYTEKQQQISGVQKMLGQYVV